MKQKRIITKSTMLHKNMAFKAQDVAADGTFEGYGSIFGNVDQGGDIVAPGAFQESLAARKASGAILPALWQHMSSKPIGGYSSVLEDSKGLALKGFLLKDEVEQAAEAYALMKAGIVTGLSIGYYPVEWTWNDKDYTLTLNKVDLQEVSIVTFPMNIEAQVESVKQVFDGSALPTVREFEEFLRDAGFSKSQAVTIANKGLGVLLGEPVETNGDEHTKNALALLKDFKLFD